MKLVRIATWSEIPERTPIAVVAERVDLVVIRRGTEYGGV